MNLEQAFYEQRFENEFLRAKGNTFQEFFEKLMGFAYKADFMACRPWGNVGDKKNDGLLKSERRLFQVYAPNEMTAKDAIEKISADFEGARTHWKEYFDKWVFVHNADHGLPHRPPEHRTRRRRAHRAGVGGVIVLAGSDEIDERIKVSGLLPDDAGADRL